MKRSEIFFGVLRLPMDAFGVLAALLLSYRLREANIDLIPRIQLLDPSPTLPPLDAYLTTFVLPGIFVFLLAAAALGLYALYTTASSWNEMGKIIVAGLLWVVVIMAWYFLVMKQLFYSRVLLVHSTFFIIFFVAMGRTAVVILQRAFLRMGVGVRLVASMGRHPIARNARDTLARDMHYEYLGHMTDLHSLKMLENKCHPDLVLQTDPDPTSKETVALIDFCRSHHIGYAFLPPVFADVPHQLLVGHLGLIPMLQFQPTPLDGWGRVFKRIFDLIGSIILIVLLSPVLIAISIAILIDSGMPLLYTSRRIGEHGRNDIHVLKFRSMIKDADKKKKDLATQNVRQDGPLFKMQNDPRVTAVGKVLRRFDLDEFPQLFNVLWGDMSLVGPRPHLPEEVSKYTSFQRRVFAVKPGMTGLAQVSGRSALKFDEEVRLDLKYVEEWSLRMDLWILWRTISVVLSGGGS
ncbi:exopolysaccharide biosynthesis polyprenyl glycosylphosphotransferase [Patescibacteria group bacterium]|nr:exopolysaccharide biosynthesis polyprenyl glycosylphosphotransferase [Patescibacteria group bacterium]